MNKPFDPIHEDDPNEGVSIQEAWKRKALYLARMTRGQRNRKERREGRQVTGHLFPLIIRPGNTDPITLHSAEEAAAYLEAHPEYTTRRIHTGAPWGSPGVAGEVNFHTVDMTPEGAEMLARLTVAYGMTPREVLAKVAERALREFAASPREDA